MNIARATLGKSTGENHPLVVAGQFVKHWRRGEPSLSTPPLCACRPVAMFFKTLLSLAHFIPVVLCCCFFLLRHMTRNP